MPFRADLHCHTTCSDGTLSPREIIQLAVKSDLQALSITDHDTIEAYKTALPLAEQVGLKLLTGVEFSTIHSKTSIHVLAYRFPLPNPKIEAFCLKHQERRKKRYQGILKLLANHKMPISEEELLFSITSATPLGQSVTVGRPHIAQMMVNLGYVISVQEAFKKYLGDDCCCYVQGEKVTTEETIDLIHAAGGLAVIAHPHLIKNSGILTQLLAMNFDGIECYYSRFPPKEHARWLKIAKHRHWLITGGSDFHGAIKPNISLGCSWVGDEEYTRLVE